jgi:hypothetical protein
MVNSVTFFAFLRTSVCAGFGLLLVASCSEKIVAQMRGDDKMDHYLFEVGEKVIPIVVQRRYFTISDLPRPREERISSLVMDMNYKTAQPIANTVETEENIATVLYQAYRENIIDKFTNNEYLNYYSMYSEKDQNNYLNLERRNIPFNSWVVQSGQDLSFLLLHKSDDNSQYDMMIECIQANARMPQGRCKMDVRLPNNVFARVHFDRKRLPEWSNIMDSALVLSSRIGINKEPM